MNSISWDRGEDEGWIGKTPVHKGLLGQWNYSVGYYNGGYMILCSC